MLFNDKQTPAKKQFLHAVFIPALISIMFILVFVFEKGMGFDFHKAGIMPRDLNQIWGIFTYIFIHADWGHLANNTTSFLILSTCLYYFYKDIATRIMILSWLISGILLWTIGRDSYHIGASGWIYALAFFLFLSGIVRGHVPLIAISLVITFWYGGMIWHVFPWKINDPISWEGHLSGVVSGCILTVIYRKKGPQKPEKIWEEDDTDEFENFDVNMENNDENDHISEEAK